MSEPWVINASPVILLAKVGLLSEVKPPLLRIREAGGYIGEELLREALRSAGEKS